MELARMNEKTYSEHWDSESNQLEHQGIYKWLNQITPIEDLIEIGSGIGLATQHLATSRKVLAIDNNTHLIAKATPYLADAGLDVKIIHADLFDLSSEKIALINNFSPKGIVGWFIGSHPDDVEKRTAQSTPMYEKPKKYRENIEDLIVSLALRVPSVEWIHLANRGGVSEAASDDFIRQETKGDYDTYVFADHGFEVVDVQNLRWNRDGSSFMYVNAPNPIFQPGPAIPCITSIVARRI